MNRAEISIFKKRDKIRFRGFLHGSYCRRLEAEARLEVLGDFTDETLERKFSHKEISRFLIPPYLPESDGPYLDEIIFSRERVFNLTRLVTMGSFYASSRGVKGTTFCLALKIVARSLTSNGLSYTE